MGRPKHLYSIYQKMTKKGKGFSEIYDLIAVRVIVKSVRDCYSALGAVHTLWHPMPGRFKDYIAMPKFNMYQSLHTTVIGPAGHARWRFRSAPRRCTAKASTAWQRTGVTRRRAARAATRWTNSFAWLRQMVDWQDETQDSREFLKDLKVDLAPTRGVRVHAEGRGHEPARRIDARGLRLCHPHRGGQSLRGRQGERGHRAFDLRAAAGRPRGNPHAEEREPFARLAQPGEDAERAYRRYARIFRRSAARTTSSSAATSSRAKCASTAWASPAPSPCARIKTVSEHLGYNDPDDMLVNIGTNKESAQHVANRLLKILVDRGTEADSCPVCGASRDIHRHAAAHAHQREAPQEARGAHVQRRGGEGHRRRARCACRAAATPCRATTSSASSRAAAACRCIGPTARTPRTS